jgi:predicted HTH domain antitoxin
MGISIKLPELNIKEDEVKLLLAIKLLEDGIVSLGKAAEIAGYSEKAFVEILIRRGIPPIKYSKLNLDKELKNACGSFGSHLDI